MVTLLLFEKRSELALNHASARSVRPESHECKLTSFCKVANYLLETYSTDNIIAKADMDKANFKQPTSQSSVQYAQAVCTELLRYRLVYDE